MLLEILIGVIVMLLIAPTEKKRNNPDREVLLPLFYMERDAKKWSESLDHPCDDNSCEDYEDFGDM
jgi:hypothetical protein